MNDGRPAISLGSDNGERGSVRPAVEARVAAFSIGAPSSTAGLAGQPIDVRRWIHALQPAIVSTNGMGRVIIGKDEQDVGLIGSLAGTN